MTKMLFLETNTLETRTTEKCFLSAFINYLTTVSHPLLTIIPE